MDTSRSSRARAYLVIVAILLAGFGVTAAAIVVLLRLIEKLH